MSGYVGAVSHVGGAVSHVDGAVSYADEALSYPNVALTSAATAADVSAHYSRHQPQQHNQHATSHVGSQHQAHAQLMQIRPDFRRQLVDAVLRRRRVQRAVPVVRRRLVAPRHPLYHTPHAGSRPRRARARMNLALDHVVCAVPDLARGVEAFADETGQRPVEAFELTQDSFKKGLIGIPSNRRDAALVK